MEVLRFDGISIPVTDVNRSAAFYQTIGFAVEQNSPRFALLRMGTTTLGLIRVKTLDDWTVALRSNIHVELNTDDLDMLYTELQERGITFYQPPQDKPWERNMAAYDPDGYRVEFAQGNRGQNQPQAAQTT